MTTKRCCPWWKRSRAVPRNTATSECRQRLFLRRYVKSAGAGGHWTPSSGFESGALVESRGTACGRERSDPAHRRMRRKLRDPAGRLIYQRRKAIVEPVIGVLEGQRARDAAIRTTRIEASGGGVGAGGHGLQSDAPLARPLAAAAVRNESRRGNPFAASPQKSRATESSHRLSGTRRF